MIEKIGINRIEREDIPDEAVISGLVRQLGIPEKRLKRWTEALYVAFGNENEPTKRIIDFLNAKIRDNA